MLGVGRGPAPATGHGVEVVPTVAPLSGVILTKGDIAEREAWAVLASVEGIGPIAFGRLLARYGTVAAILDIARRPDGSKRLTGPVAEALVRPRDAGEPAEIAARVAIAARGADAILRPVRDLDLMILTLDDPAYPSRLRAIEMPPHVLFVRGDLAALEPRSSVAVVGTRRATEYGRRIAGRIAGAIARAGGVVVSGLAIGIDGVAHEATVAERRPTVAVLGGGHGRLHPRRHMTLAERIVKTGGAIVSELAPLVEPARWTFPRRNRLISGLADASVIVEAPIKSGALITADWALEQGRECFVVPGPIDDDRAAGCLDYAHRYPGQVRIVATVAGLIEDLGIADEASAAGVDRAAVVADIVAGLGPTCRRIAAELGAGRATVDELAAATDLPVATILSGLTLLETHGLATSAYGRYRPAGQLMSREPDRRRPRRTRG